MVLSWLEQFNRFPPCLCRLYAHDGSKPVSHEELSRRSGLSQSTIRDLSCTAKWDRVPMATALKFAQACGVNLLSTWRVTGFFRHKKKTYLARAHPNARRMYDRILKQLADLDQAAA